MTINPSVFIHKIPCVFFFRGNQFHCTSNIKFLPCFVRPHQFLYLPRWFDQTSRLEADFQGKFNCLFLPTLLSDEISDITVLQHLDIIIRFHILRHCHVPHQLGFLVDNVRRYFCFILDSTVSETRCQLGKQYSSANL